MEPAGTYTYTISSGYVIPSINTSIGYYPLRPDGTQPLCTNYAIGSASLNNGCFTPPDPHHSIAPGQRLYIGARDPTDDAPVGSIIIRSQPGAKVLINGDDVSDLNDRINVLTSALNDTRDMLQAFKDMYELRLRDERVRAGEPVPVNVLGADPVSQLSNIKP